MNVLHLLRPFKLRQLPLNSVTKTNYRLRKIVSRTSSATSESAPKRKRKPQWVRILEEDADVDEDVADLLEGTDGDPDKIQAKMRAILENRELISEREGAEEPPKIVFREINPFALWVWFEFCKAPTQREKDLLDGAIRAWYTVGKLGGYNGQNLQVSAYEVRDLSNLEYENDGLQDVSGSYLHSCGDLQTRGSWARVRVDLGTADELAIDILLNMVLGFSQDLAGLQTIYVGGVNKDWPKKSAGLEDRDEEGLGDEEDDDDGLKAPRYPKVGMNPMRTPSGVDEELELLDAMMEAEKEEQQMDEPTGNQVPWGTAIASKLKRKPANRRK